MTAWQVVSRDPVENELFSTLEKTTALEGEEINRNWMSRLVRITHGERAYYVKSYRARGRGLRRHLFRSRLRAEWENLFKFKEMGVPTVRVVAFGEATNPYGGALVAEGVKGTSDLATLYRCQSPLLEDPDWVGSVRDRLALAVRLMHQASFVHSDLKWRNILAEREDSPEVYIIDCPQGRYSFGPFFARGVIKDLACLDKVAKVVLTRSQRLRFYLKYKNKERLDDMDKREIGKILDFFSGRE